MENSFVPKPILRQSSIITFQQKMLWNPGLKKKAQTLSVIFQMKAPADISHLWSATALANSRELHHVVPFMRISWKSRTDPPSVQSYSHVGSDESRTDKAQENRRARWEDAADHPCTVQTSIQKVHYITVWCKKKHWHSRSSRRDSYIQSLEETNADHLG